MKAGVGVARLEIRTDHIIIVLSQPTEAFSESTSKKNEWDV
jgi:hypothetical protein